MQREEVGHPPNATRSIALLAAPPMTSPKLTATSLVDTPRASQTIMAITAKPAKLAQNHCHLGLSSQTGHS